MNGPSHYREAERLISRAARPEPETLIVTPSPEVIALAQVHATLASAAATALAGVTLTLPQDSDLATEWNHAIGVTW